MNESPWLSVVELARAKKLEAVASLAMEMFIKDAPLDRNIQAILVGSIGRENTAKMIQHESLYRWKPDAEIRDRQPISLQDAARQWQ